MPTQVIANRKSSSNPIACSAAESGISGQAAEAAYAAHLRRFATPDRYPNVAALVAEGIFEPKPVDLEADNGDTDVGDWGLTDDIGADIAFGLRRLLDGVEVYARRPDRHFP